MGWDLLLFQWVTGLGEAVTGGWGGALKRGKWLCFLLSGDAVSEQVGMNVGGLGQLNAIPGRKPTYGLSS